MSTSVMATAPDLAGRVRPRALLSGFILAHLATALSLAVAGALWGKTGFDIVVVGMGWPHIVLGFLFYANHLIKNGGSARITFYKLLALTAAIAAVHTAKPITTFIYLYFVFHAFRDEIFIYHHRRTEYRYTGRVFDARGRALLVAAIIVTIISQVPYRPVLRTVEVPVSQLQSAGNSLISFPPIEHSRNRTYYFSLVAPAARPAPAFITYGSKADMYPRGRVLLSGRPVIGGQPVRHLEFRLNYPPGQSTGRPTADAPAAAGDDRIPLCLNGGVSIGQTFRSEADNLNGIYLPIAVAPMVPPDTKLTLQVGPAFFARFSYAYDLGLCALALLATGLSWLRVPRRLFDRIPGLSYALPASFLFLAAMATLKIARFYQVPTPLFFVFLVVFHYFSWYIFSLEKIRERGAASGSFFPNTGFDRLLQTLGTRRGFLTAVLIMNGVSFAAVYSYQFLYKVPALAWALDLKYFLYFLVFHVTVSFAPKCALKARSFAR